MGKTSPAQFIREVRRETSKVTWPTRKETMVTTGMVFVMVLVMALFFFAADQIIFLVVSWIMDIRW